MTSPVQTRAGGLPVHLLPQRAAFLPGPGMLLVADAHIGKAVSFRRLGVPVPGGTTAETLERLSAAVAATGARRIVFLGDLLHSARGRAAATLAAVERWRERHADLQLTLVRGNHDGHAGDPPAAWGVDCVDEPLLVDGSPGPDGPDGADRAKGISGLALCHHPRPVPGRYVLAGHLHPAARVGGRAHDSLRLPCFHFGPEVGVLPAFGAFTGMHLMPRTPEDRVWVVAGDAVRALPGCIHSPA